MSLEWHKKLDDFLMVLKTHKDKGLVPFFKWSRLFKKCVNSDVELENMFDLLVSRGLVTEENIGVGVGGDIDLRHFKLSLLGFLFIERGGFMNEHKRIRQRAIWTIAKIVIIAMNAILILSLMYWNVSVNNKTNSLEDVAKAKQAKIDSFSVIVAKNKLIFDSIKAAKQKVNTINEGVIKK